MATNIELDTRNCCQDYSNPYAYTFNHSQQALIVKNISDGSVITSYPLDTYINEVYTSYFDGLFFWSLEPVYLGFILRRWILSSSILRVDSTFNYISTSWLRYDSDSFSVVHNTVYLSTGAAAGSNYLSVDSVAGFVLGDDIYVGVNEDFAVYERFNISAIDEGNNYLYLDRNITYGYDSGKAVVKLGKIWIYNNYSPYDETEACALKINHTDGSLSAYTRSGIFRNVEAASYYDGNVLVVNGHSVLFIDDTTNKINKIMYIDNAGTDRAAILPIYSIFIKSDLLYRLQTSRVYYSGGWQEEDWSPNYNFVTDTTVSQVHFVELFARMYWLKF
jgi:hypothetical protein